MSIGRKLRTARHIPVAQLTARAKAMWRRNLYAADPEAPMRAAALAAQGTTAADPLPRLPPEIVAPEGIEAVRARAAAFAAGRFEYLHRAHDFSAGVQWSPEGSTPLWRYQLQYLGAVRDLALAGRRDAAAALLASWRDAFAARWHVEAWHPYPASLRLVNLCHAAAALGGFEQLGTGTTALVAQHAAFVADHLEMDVRGNHILENVRALVVASRFLAGPLAQRCEAVAKPLLDVELAEQILPDGAHFELSPMYHRIVLQGLMEIRALGAGGDALAAREPRMREFLRGILCPDGEIPLLGDSARGFAPPVSALALEGPRLPRGVASFPDCGLSVFRGDGVWAIYDTGPVCPDSLPAHGQADSLTVEVWFDGRRIVGDPGVGEYTGPERAWGRSSRAHSTLTIDDEDTSEVYGSFRVGGRAQIVFVDVKEHEVTAAMVPFDVDARFSRIVGFEGAERRGLRIVDDGLVPQRRVARSRLHLAPYVRIVEGGDGATSVVVASADVHVRITSPHPIRTEPGRASWEFGKVEPTTILVQDLLREGERRDVHGGWVLEPAW